MHLREQTGWYNLQNEISDYALEKERKKNVFFYS